MASVAATTSGARIGKGKGYAEMEYAIMRELNIIQKHTIVATTVHDCQLVQSSPVHPDSPSFPDSFMESHDLPVDIIATPTKIIYTHTIIPKPSGIDWNKITHEMVKDIPVLGQLMAIQQAKNIHVPLPSSSTPLTNARSPPKYTFTMTRGCYDEDSQNTCIAADNRPPRQRRTEEAKRSEENQSKGDSEIERMNVKSTPHPGNLGAACSRRKEKKQRTPRRNHTTSFELHSPRRGAKSDGADFIFLDG